MKITTLILLILISCKCSTVKKDAGTPSNTTIDVKGRTAIATNQDTTGIDSSYWHYKREEPYNPKQILYDSCKMKKTDWDAFNEKQHAEMGRPIMNNCCEGHGDVADYKFPKPFQATITSTGILSLPKQYDTVYVSDSTLIIKIFVNKVTFDTLVYKINRFQINK